MHSRETLLTTEEKRSFFLAGLLLTLSVAAGMIPFVLVVDLVRQLASETPQIHTIRTTLLIITALLAMKAVLYGATHIISHTAAYKVLVSLRLKLIRHMERMNIAFFHRHKIGELTKVLNFDVEQVENYLAHGLPEIATATLIPACAVLMVAFIDYRLGLALLAVVPLVLGTSALLQRHWAPMFATYLDKLKTMSEELMEYIGTITVIKAFSGHENRTEKMMRSMDGYTGYLKRMCVTMIIPASISGVFMEAGVAAVAIIGCLLLKKGEITLYELILAIFLSTAFCASLARLSLAKHFNIVFMNASRQIQSITDEEPQRSTANAINTPKQARGTLTLIGEISFENVSLSYDNGRDAVQGVSLTIPSGSLTAFTGISGAGKSSIAHLIMGFYSPTKGRIHLGGREIQTMTEKEISAMVSMVQQDVFLFNTTIAENIRIGRADATDLEVVAAAKKARIHDFIESLPMGYETMVGEKGARLSGGEKQRISIARALLKDAPIIIFDEATSSVDAENEAQIQEAIGELREGRTVIMITHHLSTIVHADRIILMDAGQISAQGTHPELLESSRDYIHLWNEKSSTKSWTIKEVSAT